MAHVIKILDIQSGYFMEFCSFCSQNQINFTLVSIK